MHVDPRIHAEALVGGTVAVVTATRGRPDTLMRTIDSVSSQCCDHVAAHLVLVDDCDDTWTQLRRHLPSHVWARMVRRSTEDVTGPVRLGHLRDVGASLAKTQWLAFIDDDNEWEHDHLHSLLDVARKADVSAAHSWQRVTNRDGSPYLEERYPWPKTEAERISAYKRVCELSVMEPGSSLIKTRASRQVLDAGVVDAGEWLLDRVMVQSIGFTCELSDDDYARGIGDDDKFVGAMLDAKIQTACSMRPTFIYHLGGPSNSGVRVDKFNQGI